MSKKESLITCDRVYYQLKWHENADQKKAHLKFLNFGQLKTIPYHNWIPIDKGGETNKGFTPILINSINC